MGRPRLRLGLVLVLVFASGCSGLRSGGEGPAERTDNRLDGHGVSVRLPRAWDGRIAERGFPLPGATVVYAASFPLPARDDEPASKAQRAVRRGDVLVILSETLHNLSLPTTKPAIALNTRGASVDQYFIANGRAFALRATFGSKSPAKKLIRSVNALLASLTVERRNRPLTPAPDPVPASALAPVELFATRARVLTQCRLAQARSRFPILCPARLPRPFLGWPRSDRVPEPSARALPAPSASWRSRSDPRYLKRQAGGLSIGYGAPWEPDSGPDWRLHLWRNRPCCFLHFEVFRRAEGRQHIPAGSHPAMLGGRRGLLKDASSYGLASRENDYLYWPNHTRFLWQENGVAYVATLHRFGTNQETRALLGRLIRELRPVHSGPGRAGRP
jgi:hypothetical protein